MSVSIVQGPGLDMDAIVAGGPDLIRRMTDFKEQRDAAVQALADLQLGRQVTEARDELARDRAAFEAQKAADIANFEKHMSGITADMDAWKRDTVAKYMADSEAAAAARAEAEKAAVAAKQALADAERKNADADSRLADVVAKQAAFRQAAAVLGQV